jgi:hypothetical protein
MAGAPVMNYRSFLRRSDLDLEDSAQATLW